MDLHKCPPVLELLFLVYKYISILTLYTEISWVYLVADEKKMSFVIHKQFMSVESE